MACASLFSGCIYTNLFLWPVMDAFGVVTLDHMLLEILISFAWLNIVMTCLLHLDVEV